MAEGSGKPKWAWLEHKFFIAALAAIFGIAAAVVQGLFQVASTRMQIEASHAASLVPAQTQSNGKFSTSQNTTHSLILNYGGRRLITSHSDFKEGFDYRVRFEGCYSTDGDAICAFTVKPTGTIVVTNLENKSRGTRVDDSDAAICCMSMNEESEFTSLWPTAEHGNAPVIRHTLSEEDEAIVRFLIPKIKNSPALDAIIFSRGQGDKGVTFKMKISPLPDVTPITADQIRALRVRLEDDKRDGVLGNQNGPITLVEFLDYQCPWCRAGEGDVQKLLDENRDVKLVIKQFPILDTDLSKAKLSKNAARLALASVSLGRFKGVHERLMASDKLTKETLSAISGEIKLREPVFSFDEYIDDSKKLARTIGMTGTPTFIVDGSVVEGFDREALRRAIVKARGGQR